MPPNFPTRWNRPAYSVLDLSTTERLLGTIPDWHERVRAVVASLRSSD